MFTCTPSALFRGAAAAATAAVLLAAGPAPRAAALEPGEFDPAGFDSLLTLYAGADGVDYAAWKAGGTEALDRFLERAAAYDLTSTLGKEPRAAFLINAYNARAVRMVLEHYPVESLKDIDGFFDDHAVKIAGAERTLNDIETALAGILPHQPGFAFALAPGAKGMPALGARAYTSEDLAGRFVVAAGAYFADGGTLSYDRENKVMHLPPPFQTHWALFEALPQGIVGFLADHLPLADVMALTREKPDYAFDAVDWTLRDASGASGEDDAPSGSDGGR